MPPGGVVPFDTVLVNGQGIYDTHYNNVTSPVAGLYFLSFHLTLGRRREAGVRGAYVNVQLATRKAGFDNEKGKIVATFGGKTDQEISGSAVVAFAAGDSVWLRAQPANAADLVIVPREGGGQRLLRVSAQLLSGGVAGVVGGECSESSRAIRPHPRPAASPARPPRRAGDARGGRDTARRVVDARCWRRGGVISGLGLRDERVLELCSFSGYKIYPGHGVRYARVDGKVFQFLNAKCESAFLSKRNPRQINWTVLYRRKHKKGQQEEVSKKRSRRAVKAQRAITGATLSDILAKRNQKPEIRKAQREQAIRAAKEAKKVKTGTKKSATAPAKAAVKAAPKQKIAKTMKSAAPRVGGKR
ncbi:unnamed protein product [Lampetra planeri]